MRERGFLSSISLSLGSTFVAVAVSMAGCSMGDAPIDAAERRSALGGPSALVPLFNDVADDTGVPAEILATVAFVETRLRARDTHVHAGEGAHGLAAIGMMALHEGGARDIERAAALVGLDPAFVAIDTEANVRAAAALLADHNGDAIATRDLRDWGPALRAYGGDALAREVLGHIERGWQSQDVDGERVVCSARLGARTGDGGFGERQLGLGYPGAIWNPAHSSNYNNASRGAGQINYVIIHTTQGSYSGTISWFKNPASDVSAHYVVRSSDGETTQMVDDSDIGWHDACFNSETIGIEHEGFVAEPSVWYTEAMYMRSAQLTAWLATQYGIPMDRAHIMGHGEAPDCSSHTDPGSGWNWAHYMDLVHSGGEPSYDASFVAQDTPQTMVSGEEVVVWFDFQNNSNVTWGLNETRLGTADPMDHDSPFFVDGNWMSPSRATGADHSNYSPGAVGRFTFVIRAPEVDEPTEFVEKFQLVQEGEAWFGPVVTMAVTVNPTDGPADPTDPANPNGDVTDPTRGSGDVDDGSVGGGCAVGGGAGSGWCAIMLLGVLLFRRRRA